MPAPLSLHVDRTALLGRTLLGALGVMIGLTIVGGYYVGPRISRCFCQDAGGSQRTIVRQISSEGFITWSRKHPEARCPGTLMEVAAEVDRRDTRDAWGNELIWYCGDSMPAGVTGGFAVRSLGPDELVGTVDDVVSWE